MTGFARSCFRMVAPVPVLALLAGAALVPQARAQDPAFRPPAVPLVTSDPYLSIWSEADRLTDDVTRHWTHHPQSLLSLIRIDGAAYRLMGNQPAGIPPLPQVSLQVTPTRSIYEFANQQVRVTLTFMTPLLPDDLNVLTRPVTYLAWSVASADGAPHAVSLFESTSSTLAVNAVSEPVVWARDPISGLAALRVGTAGQPVLQTAGDDTRINWGYAYAAAPAATVQSALTASQISLDSFVHDGSLPAVDDTRMPRPPTDDEPVMAFAWNLGQVGAAPVSRHMMIAYDELYSIRYFGQKLLPYWRRHGATPAALLRSAERDFSGLTRRCETFDRMLTADLKSAGGDSYARIGALAYRQAIAGTGIAADPRGQPLLFTKENTSNGDIATVDVIYPMEPIFLLLCPALAKAALVSNLDYAASPRWKFPFAPHDLGTYPIVTGRDEGGEIMEVEESGNMILLLTAIAQIDGNARFASHWWPQVTRWAEYIKAQGFDLPNQLTTDDFAGPSAHNANLAIKAALALDGYGRLCDMRGDAATGRQYHDLARDWAARWQAAADDGDHYRLAYDRPGSWSQKYNLVWDKVLGLHCFPPAVAQKEMAFYLAHLNPFGLPLDSRQRYTKTDWTLWTATLADNPDQFAALADHVVDFLNATPDRVPFSDFYWTQDAHDAGMHARPVIGAVFIKLLANPAVWRRWAAAGASHVGPWAPLPRPPQVTEVVPTSRLQPVVWRYTVQQPPDGWTLPGFDDSAWMSGPAGFGTAGTPGIEARTTWNTPDIWIRRQFTMPPGRHPNLQLLVYHDEDVEVFLNGVLAATEGGFTTGYQPLEIHPAARALLQPGTSITIAIHCHQTVGGQGVDAGLVDVQEHPSSRTRTVNADTSATQR